MRLRQSPMAIASAALGTFVLLQQLLLAKTPRAEFITAATTLIALALARKGDEQRSSRGREPTSSSSESSEPTSPSE